MVATLSLCCSLLLAAYPATDGTRTLIERAERLANLGKGLTLAQSIKSGMTMEAVEEVLGQHAMAWGTTGINPGLFVVYDKFGLSVSYHSYVESPFDYAGMEPLRYQTQYGKLYATFVGDEAGPRWIHRVVGVSDWRDMRDVFPAKGPTTRPLKVVLRLFLGSK